MAISKKAAVLTAIMFSLAVPAAPAFAQAVDDDYVGGNPIEVPAGGETGGAGSGETPAGGETGEISIPGGETGGELAGEEAGGDDTGAAGAAQTAPTGSLPITGGDAVGLAVIGAAAVATGTVLVRRSRRDAAVV